MDSRQSKSSADRLPTLPRGWHWTTLGDAFTWSSGGTPLRSRAAYYDGGDIPWAVIGDLNDGIVTTTKSHITWAGLDNSAAKWVEEGSILIAMYGSIGKLGIAGRRLTTNQAIAFTMPDPSMARYLFYYLMGQRRNLLSLGMGATQQNISQTIIKAYPFPVAPAEARGRIVARIEELLSDLDAGVAALERVRAGLKRYKASVLQAAVTGRLLGGNEALPPGELPEGWRWAKVEEIARVETGATPLRSEERYWLGGTIPWITSGSLNESFITEADESITDLALEETNAKVFPRGTLLVAMYGEGRTRGMVSELMISAATNQACAALVFDADHELYRPYVKLFLETNYESIRRQSSGGVQPNLNLSVIKKTRLPLPPTPQMGRTVIEVGRRLSVAGQLASEVRAGLLRATRLRQAVLKAAFEGRL